MKYHLTFVAVLLLTACNGGSGNQANEQRSSVSAAITNKNSIDPGKFSLPLVARFGSYLGGKYFERAQSVYIDTQGYIYIGGHTKSADFPVTNGAFDTHKHGPSGNGDDTGDGFVTKISPDGSKIIWSTLIGGSRRDQVYAIRTDSQGNVYLLGATGSEDFPATRGAYDETFNGPVVANGITDIFVSSLTPDGKTLRFSTFVGGTRGTEDNPRGALYIDERRGRIYVAGQTGADDFPTTKGALQEQYGGGSEDAFVFALSIDGKKLIASTYLGGTGSETAFTAIAPHPSGDSFYIAGATNSPNFPMTKGVFQEKLASGDPTKPWWESGDAYVARISANLDKLVFSTLYGGSKKDAVSHNQGLAVDDKGSVVIIGHTNSPDLPVTANAFDRQLNGETDVFVAIFSDAGKLEHASYLGGSNTEEIAGVVVGPGNRIYVTGGTRSDDFAVTLDAYQKRFGNHVSKRNLSDAFLTVFDPGLQRVEYSTYLGGSGSMPWSERGRACWITPSGRLIVGGVTDSSDFPIKGPSIQTKPGGSTDVFYIIFEPVH